MTFTKEYGRIFDEMSTLAPESKDYRYLVDLLTSLTKSNVRAAQINALYLDQARQGRLGLFLGAAGLVALILIVVSAQRAQARRSEAHAALVERLTKIADDLDNRMRSKKPETGVSA